MLERSLTQASALLAQCFYLLATSEIDRCWAYLGLAVRLAQSIGLHADIQDHGSSQPNSERPQIRSRVWYSLYVLDRLTALQLGRPSAISDHDCHVPIPSRIDGLDPDINDGEVQEISKEGRAGEYFVRLIEFSSIIGRVLRECYHPRRDVAARLQSTKDCDLLLLTWKQKLPRYLRFDLGHAFEKSITLKRQVFCPVRVASNLSADSDIAEHVGHQVPPPAGVDPSTLPIPYIPRQESLDSRSNMSKSRVRKDMRY